MKDNSALPILLGFLLLFVVLATMASVVLAFVTIINIYGYGVGMIAAIIFNILVLILSHGTAVSLLNGISHLILFFR